jgi:hypothetical protein
MVRSSRRRQVAAVLARREREGLSLASLSADTGIPIGTLSWWAWRLRQESGPRAGFVELSVTDGASGGGAGVIPGGGDLVVETAAGTRISMPVPVTPGILRVVLDAVEGRC